MTELYRLTATEAVSLLGRGEITPAELVEASIARIEAVDGTINALPIHCFERARDQAAAISSAPRATNSRSLLGLPIAVKDYNDVGGVRTDDYDKPVAELRRLFDAYAPRIPYYRIRAADPTIGPFNLWQKKQGL